MVAERCKPPELASLEDTLCSIATVMAIVHLHLTLQRLPRQRQQADKEQWIVQSR